MIGSSDNYCKAAKLLFRRLYKPEEYSGGSLTGARANNMSANFIKPDENKDKTVSRPPFLDIINGSAGASGAVFNNYAFNIYHKK